jgi:hypothetical protein
MDINNPDKRGTLISTVKIMIDNLNKLVIDQAEKLSPISYHCMHAN